MLEVMKPFQIIKAASYFLSVPFAKNSIRKPSPKVEDLVYFMKSGIPLDKFKA